MKLKYYLIGGLLATAFGAGVLFSFSPQNYNHILLKNLLAERVEDDAPLDLGVVLGAGLRTNGALTDIAKERVDYALLIHEQIDLPLLFSGGDTPYGVEAQAMNAYAKEQGYDGPDYIEGSSRSTYENAFFCDQLLDGADEQIESEDLLLITSSFHSRRSLATFKTIMPEREIEIDYPQHTVILDNSFIGRWKGLRMLLREYLAIEWYKYGHQIDEL